MTTTIAGVGLPPADEPSGPRANARSGSARIGATLLSWSLTVRDLPPGAGTPELRDSYVAQAAEMGRRFTDSKMSVRSAAAQADALVGRMRLLIATRYGTSQVPDTLLRMASTLAIISELETELHQVYEPDRGGHARRVAASFASAEVNR